MIAAQVTTLRRSWETGAALFRTFAPYTLVLLVVLLVAGPEVQSRRISIRVDLLLVTYPLGAFVTGWLIGFAMPASRHLILAVPAAVLAIVPWIVGISVAMDRGYANWGTEHTVVSAATALLLGSRAGITLWLSQRPSSTRRSRPRPAP